MFLEHLVMNMDQIMVILGSSSWFTNLGENGLIHGIKDYKQITFVLFHLFINGKLLPLQFIGTTTQCYLL